jgi:hypothetical protein
MSGYAVVIDTFENPGEPPCPFLAVEDISTATHLIRAGLPQIRDNANHTFRVQLDSGKVSAWIDLVNYVFQFSLPGYLPYAGHWGFTASTGGESTAQWVTAISMSFPKGQGCVP